MCTRTDGGCIMCARRPWDIARPSTPGHHDCRITPGGVTTSDVTIGDGTTGVTTGSVTTWQQCNSGSDSPGSHGMAPWTRIVRVADGASGGCESDSSVMGGATGGVAAGGGAMSGAACGGSTLQPHPRPHPHRRPRPKTFILRRYRYRILLFGFYYRYYVYFRLRVCHLQHTGGASTDAVQKRVLTQWSVSEHSRSVSENSRSVSANARSVFLQMQGQFPQMEMRTVSFRKCTVKFFCKFRFSFRKWKCARSVSAIERSSFRN